MKSTLGSVLATARRERGLSREGLANLLHVSRTAVHLWENDRARPTPDKLERLAEVLGLTVADLSAPSSAPHLPPGRSPAPPDVPPVETIPVFQTTARRHAPHDEFDLAPESAHFVHRPPRLRGRRDVFALYAPGESMAPWAPAGSLLIVEQMRAPRPGDHVVARIDHNGEAAHVLGRLLEATADHVTLEQYTPAQCFMLERDRVGALLRVMELSELLGG